MKEPAINKLGWLIGAIAVIGILYLVIWWKVSIWKECRQTNSWMYCVHMINH
jgi:hypothetical protein